MNEVKLIADCDLFDRRFAFGVTGARPLITCWEFLSDGSIRNSMNSNERFWAQDEQQFYLLDENRHVFWISRRVYLSEGALHIDFTSLRSPGVRFTAYECAPEGFKGPGRQPGLAPADFLFPNDLSRMQIVPRNVLIIGSCLSSTYRSVFASKFAPTQFHHILFNFASKLEALDESLLYDIDFQYVQIPARSVITDRVINDPDTLTAHFFERIYQDGCRIIDQMLDFSSVL